jgi:Mg-chelatase subunit ChlD
MADELNQVDLAFVVDTTGSMGQFIAAAQRQMIDVLRALTKDAQVAIDLQVGVVEYRDHPPQEQSFVYRVHGLTGNLARAQKAINKLKADGGGDTPEAVYDGLCAACDELSWRTHSRRIAVLVGDAPPHGVSRCGDHFPNGCPQGLTLDSTTAGLEDKGVVLYTLGLTRHVAQSFADLAHYTGGQHFEARQGAEAIETLKALLIDEFSDLEFDRQVLNAWRRDPEGSMQAICEALDSPRGKVSSSLSRLGRRRLLV